MEFNCYSACCIPALIHVLSGTLKARPGAKYACGNNFKAVYGALSCIQRSYGKISYLNAIRFFCYIKFYYLIIFCNKLNVNIFKSKKVSQVLGTPFSSKFYWKNLA